MPYIIIRGNLASYSHKYPWRVLVSGLKADEIEQLNQFSCGGYSDESTIVYLVHPCRVLSALEILGFRVVASSSTSVKQDYNEYMWTMRKEFHEPEPIETSDTSVVRENLSNIDREAGVFGNYHKVDSPE
ncbi:uncharacterized protein LOC129920115 [Episyrphus balteatus]|uniref:uncharacterized protein LOC129920115 n=1 Tax=Episyrphus balteatus TaxID=286459 RepID=UPI002485CDF5|nr:uncharacterized protein LOC129920115 [Episyrphus balteatus]XP_055857306.1 uncharacterized protein LOC129920115 [Episyrphus balteatus]